MNLHIAPENGLIFVIGCLVGLLVYRQTRRASGNTQMGGDLAMAITVVAAVVATLALVLGIGGDHDPRGDKSPTSPTSTP
ncbi:hypothetical protein [Streptomyces sp. SID10853]|uniref:hypothetical protein n=1 Tax=Streptomyces sp. SID10853 TaxID=2706028 RepID=UPI0013DAAD4E|nr:hypothetical protein [Streptomyces sp. SID10853]